MRKENNIMLSYDYLCYYYGLFNMCDIYRCK